MRQWLSARKAGIEVIPNPNDPTSVLRPSRATTVGEKLEMKKRKQQNKQQTEGQKKIKKDIVDLQEQAAAEGCARAPSHPPVSPPVRCDRTLTRAGVAVHSLALNEQMTRSLMRQPESLTNAMGDMTRCVSRVDAHPASADARGRLSAVYCRLSVVF